MKSDFIKERYYIECDCQSLDHILIFEFLEEDDSQPEISIYFSSNWRDKWYKRIWQALKFVFMKTPYIVSDVIIVSSENIKQLKDIIKKTEKFNNTK